jgi:hypothetical protein
MALKVTCYSVALDLLEEGDDRSRDKKSTSHLLGKQILVLLVWLLHQLLVSYIDLKSPSYRPSNYESNRKASLF